MISSVEQPPKGQPGKEIYPVKNIREWVLAGACWWKFMVWSRCYCVFRPHGWNFPDLLQDVLTDSTAKVWERGSRHILGQEEIPGQVVREAVALRARITLFL